MLDGKIYGIPVKALLGVGLVIALGLALWLWGNARYKAGADATDRKWAEASEKLKVQAAAAGTKASEASVVRVEEYQQKLTEEKERLDEAQAQGSSPFDVLFGG